MSALLPLYKALTTLFRGDATLMALLPGGFHNGSAPSTATRPYLVMGTPTEFERNVLDRWGQDVTIELDTFSPSTVKSSVQVDTILDRVETLLREPLTLDNHNAARAKKEFRTVLVEDDDTRHGMSRYRFFTFESATK